jgi:hypothetical protein
MTWIADIWKISQSFDSMRESYVGEKVIYERKFWIGLE